MTMTEYLQIIQIVYIFSATVALGWMILQTIEDFKDDRKSYHTAIANEKDYECNMTLGGIVARLIVSFIPLVNTVIALSQLTPIVWDLIVKFFTIKLGPSYKAKPKEVAIVQYENEQEN